MIREAGLKNSINRKKRTLYSLRHTAIVADIHSGISEQKLAINARTSVDMIDRFFGLHINSALDRAHRIF